MGLLDNIFGSEEGRLGIGLLAAAMPSNVPQGQRLMGVLAQQDAWKQSQMDNKLMQAQLDDRTMQTQARRAQQEAAMRKQQAIPSLFSQSDATGGAPGGVGGFNVQAAIAAGFDPEEIQKYAALQNLGRQEVARTIETTDAQGRPITVQLDKFGGRIGEGMGAWKAPVSVNQGDRTTFVDPATMQPRGSFGVNMSPGERDASARGWAANALARERLNVDRSQGGKPTFNADAGGFIYPPSQDNPRGNIVPLQGFQKPLNDVQSKALLFGTRMQESDKIINDLNKRGKSFSTPGANAGFGIGALVNTVNSEGAQMLDQAKRDFINATLRRESGAAIAESEFTNAEKQYFPQIGDSPKVIEQKAKNRALASQGVLAEVPKGAPGLRTGGATGSFDAPVPRAPMKGQVGQGFKFKGGDPGNQANWEKQ